MQSKEEKQLAFFESMNDPNYDKYLAKLDVKKYERIRNRTKSSVYSVSPITCQGPDKCPFLSKCPIPEYDEDANIIKGLKKDYPIGQPCIVEKFHIEQKVVDYMKYLDVDPSNPVEMSIVEELALVDLMKVRCLNILSNGDKENNGRDFLLKEITGFNENGDISTNTKVHPLVDLIDRIEKRRERWLERLMETRKAKAEFVAKLGSEENNNKILGEIQKLRTALLNASPETDSDLLLLDED
jgi:hypothetical protein